MNDARFAPSVSQGTFLLLAALTWAFVAAFALLVSDDPQTHPGVPEDERRRLRQEGGGASANKARGPRNGHTIDSHATDGHAANGHHANDQAPNGHGNGGGPRNSYAPSGHHAKSGRGADGDAGAEGAGGSGGHDALRLLLSGPAVAIFVAHAAYNNFRYTLTAWMPTYYDEVCLSVCLSVCPRSQPECSRMLVVGTHPPHPHAPCPCQRGRKSPTRSSIFDMCRPSSSNSLTSWISLHAVLVSCTLDMMDLGGMWPEPRLPCRCLESPRRRPGYTSQVSTSSGSQSRCC